MFYLWKRGFGSKIKMVLWIKYQKEFFEANKSYNFVVNII